MAERKPLSKSIRFEVFKRDNFTCRYCGSKAPEVILEVDHINPVSKGGDNEIMNLITSCFVCNRGKSNKLLSDNSVVEKQRLQIEELNIRRQQLEMMLEWRDEVIKYKDFESDKAISFYNSKLQKIFLNENGQKTMSSYVKKHGLIKVLDAIDISFEKYYDSDEDAQNVLNKIGGILNIQSMPEHRQKISYIIGVCKNKFMYTNNHVLINLLTKYHQLGMNLDFLLTMLRDNQFKNYSELKNHLERNIE
jgi:HNH endonuclease